MVMLRRFISVLSVLLVAYVAKAKPTFLPKESTHPTAPSLEAGHLEPSAKVKHTRLTIFKLFLNMDSTTALESKNKNKNSAFVKKYFSISVKDGADKPSDMPPPETETEPEPEPEDDYVYTCETCSDQFLLRNENFAQFVLSHVSADHDALMKLLIESSFPLDEPRKEISGPLYITPGCADCVATGVDCSAAYCPGQCGDDMESDACGECFTLYCRDAFLGCSMGITQMYPPNDDDDNRIPPPKLGGK